MGHLPRERRGGRRLLPLLGLFVLLKVGTPPQSSEMGIHPAVGSCALRVR